MRLTIATEEGSTFNIDVDSSMELENVMALLEAEVSHTFKYCSPFRGCTLVYRYKVDKYYHQHKNADLINSAFYFTKF